MIIFLLFNQVVDGEQSTEQIAAISLGAIQHISIFLSILFVQYSKADSDDMFPLVWIPVRRANIVFQFLNNGAWQWFSFNQTHQDILIQNTPEVFIVEVQILGFSINTIGCRENGVDRWDTNFHFTLIGRCPRIAVFPFF